MNNNKNNRRKKKNNVSLESNKDFPSLPIKKSFKQRNSHITPPTTSQISSYAPPPTTSQISSYAPPPTTSNVTLNEIYYNNNIIYKKAMNGYIYLKSLPCLEKECKIPIFY